MFSDQVRDKPVDSQKIARGFKLGFRPDMTEKLLTRTLNLNKTKSNLEGLY